MPQLPNDSFVDPDDQDNNTSSNPTFQQVLHSGLSRRNVLRGGLGGAEDLQALGAEQVDDARGERAFGADHRERDVLALGEGRQRLEVRDRHVLQVALARGTAVARRHVDHLHAAGLRLAIHYRASAQAAQALAAELNADRPDTAATFAADLLDKLGTHISRDDVDQESVTRLKEAVNLIERRTAPREEA
jgi:hypothetical protein